MDEFTNFFKLLSDETRQRIVILLAQEELCVCEICSILELSQPKISKHLTKLRDKSFVSDKRKDQYVFYSLNINDNILLNFIKSIIANIDKYPTLLSDSKRLRSKDSYSNKCNLQTGK